MLYVLALVCAVLFLVVLQQRGALARLRAAQDEALGRLEHAGREAREAEARAQRETRERPARERALRLALLEPLLGIDDHVQRALAHSHTSDADALRQGLELLARDLDAVWRRLGVERLEAGAGTPFDPALHDAIAREDVPLPEPDSAGAGEPDTTAMTARIARVASDGFRFEGQVVRPARVVVAVAARPAGVADEAAAGEEAEASASARDLSAARGEGSAG